MKVKNLDVVITNFDGETLTIPNGKGKDLELTFKMVYETALYHQEQGQTLKASDIVERFDELAALHKADNVADLKLETVSYIKETIPKVGFSILAAGLAIKNLEA